MPLFIKDIKYNVLPSISVAFGASEGPKTGSSPAADLLRLSDQEAAGLMVSTPPSASRERLRSIDGGGESSLSGLG